MRAILWDKPKCEVYVDLADMNEENKILLSVDAETIAKSVKVYDFRIKDGNTVEVISNYNVDYIESDLVDVPSGYKITIYGENATYTIQSNEFTVGEATNVAESMIAPEYEDGESYTAGTLVTHGGKLYTFNEDYSGDTWDDSVVTETTVAEQLASGSGSATELVTLTIYNDGNSVSLNKTFAEVTDLLFNGSGFLSKNVLLLMNLANVEDDTVIRCSPYFITSFTASGLEEGDIDEIKFHIFAQSSTDLAVYTYSLSEEGLNIEFEGDVELNDVNAET